MKRASSRWRQLLSFPIAGCLLFFTAASIPAQDHSQHTKPAASAAEKKSSPAKQAPQAAQRAEDVPQVEISSDQQKLIGVKTVKAAYLPMKRVIRAVGRVDVDESRQATINAKIEGWIEKLYVDKTGSYVRKGERLAEIYSPELVATQEEFLTALKWTKETGAASQGEKSASSDISRMLAKDAAATLAAARQRLVWWDISPAQIKTIEETGRPVRTLTLYAPVSGFVTQKMVVAGMRIMPGEKMFDIVDLSSLWVIADIYEYELPFVKVGNPATITLSYLPGVEITSRIDYIYPNVSAETRTIKVRLKIANHHHQLKPQMFGDVVIRVDLGKKLVIPESAVMDTGTAMVVYVDRGEGAYEPREIKTGLRAEGIIEVLRGLKSGERVVAAANFLVDSEAQLKGIKPLPSK